MSKEQPPLTDEEKYELALQTEHELARLARTYTIMERNRAEFMGSGGAGKLAKYKKVLDLFRKEQKNILTDLAVASAGARLKEDKKLSNKLATLLVEYDDFDNEIKKERNYTKEIEDQIQIVKKETLDLAAKQISDDKHQQRVLKGEQTVQTLENKLEVQIKKFCVICAQNVNLRSEIHHLLNERNEFNKIWDRLINNLCVGKKFMIDLIEQATIAYDQREEWVSKLQVLRTKAHNDLVAHIQEMREQQRKRDNDIKLQEFFAIKGQKRIMKDLADLQLKKRQKNKSLIQLDLEKYLNILINIKDFTNQDYVPEIAKEFINQEEENFAKFQYVNDLNNQMEQISDSLSKCHEGIDEQKVIHESRRLQQENDLSISQKMVEDHRQEASKKEAELKLVEQKLQNVLTGIGTLFKLFRCDNDPLLKLLDIEEFAQSDIFSLLPKKSKDKYNQEYDRFISWCNEITYFNVQNIQKTDEVLSSASGHNETIHYYNVILYLEILEKNIQESLVTVHYKEKSAAAKKKGPKPEQFVVRQDRLPGPIEPVERICNTNPCPLCIEHDLVSDVIDQLQFACTKEEIQQKLASRLKIDGSQAALHNVSACHLPKSRQIIQKRYQ